jgi:hypothetical protein
MNENFDLFDNYAMKFDFNEESIRRKYEHSYRVMRESDAIVYSIGLEEDDSFLASFIGLFHDLGRFEQWTKYKTFDDSVSTDHALLASELLFKNNMVKKTNLEEKDYDVVRIAIENHSKYEIDNKIKDEKVLLHSKIVRDADKIDIFYQISNPRIIELKSDDSQISEKVKYDFYSHRCVRHTDIQSINDRIISTLSMIYDLNFDYSKKTILEKEYLDRILEYLNNKKLFKPFFEEAIKYLRGCEEKC